MPRLLIWYCLAALTAAAAPSDAVPDSARRPVVVTRDAAAPDPAPPPADLPPGFTLELAAAPPLVTHPIAACRDDLGRLFLGDAVGVNWNKAQLEAAPPNRVLMLEDTDRDGRFDRSTVFADAMTFPQGALWLDGSLYVASPPGIWKLTDTDGDGVADQRRMIVTGFDYTGNAADVHGPFLHPGGRLFWCHGRKGYRVPGPDGTVLHEGKSSGIWSANPDGGDVRWHALLAGDNPVEVDFTPHGDVVGVQNIYHTQPRGDTVVHWLAGGVYERPDQAHVLAGLPRTLETMPVLHNFGHVAVSGSCFWRASAALFPKRPPGTLDFLVTHFNTQRLVRVELTPEGSSFQAREHEFLKVHAPDIHFTDVLEEPDGSLLLLDTGGWFRIGCPSSLLAKPDVLGAVYRLRRPPPESAPAPSPTAWFSAYTPPPSDAAGFLDALAQPDPAARRRALDALAATPLRDPALDARLLALMEAPLDPPLEHALLWAALRLRLVTTAEPLRTASSPVALRRLFACLSPEPGDDATAREALAIAGTRLDDPDSSLARAALRFILASPNGTAQTVARFRTWVDEPTLSDARLQALGGFVADTLAISATQDLLTAMLGHPAAPVRRAAWKTLAEGKSAVSPPDWLPLLAAGLTQPDGPDPLLLDALKSLKTPDLDAPLQALASDASRPAALRLKALAAMHRRAMTPEVFALLLRELASPVSAAARVQAASLLGSSALAPDQLAALAPSFASVGPVELPELLRPLRGLKDPDLARTLTRELARNPALASQQESFYRTLLSNQPPDLFEAILLPALRDAEAATDAKKRLITPLAEASAAEGDPEAGRAHFAAGKGTCIACHRIGDQGRPLGPDLSAIGAIRTERDLLESILFPSNTLARDYEAHVIETVDGQSLIGVIRSHTAEGLLVADAAGVERNVPHDRILSRTQLPVSLMPSGLDATLTRQELLDLVAYLRSLRG